MLKLHLGCGNNHLDSWVNIDIRKLPTVDLVHDISKQLPYFDNSVDLIYCEHVFEHFTLDEGITLLKDWYRALRIGGRVRIAVPDLNGLIKKFQTGSWRIEVKARRRKNTNAMFMNRCFYDWGHRFLYDEETLKLSMKKSNFKNIKKQMYGKSYRCPEMCNLERRPSYKTDLIIEGEKR